MSRSRSTAVWVRWRPWRRAARAGAAPSACRCPFSSVLVLLPGARNLITGGALLCRYHSDTQSMKIAQGVSGTVKDKGCAQRNIPFLMQAARQGFQVGLACKLCLQRHHEQAPACCACLVPSAERAGCPCDRFVRLRRTSVPAALLLHIRCWPTRRCSLRRAPAQRRQRATCMTCIRMTKCGGERSPTIASAGLEVERELHWTRAMYVDKLRPGLIRVDRHHSCSAINAIGSRRMDDSSDFTFPTLPAPKATNSHSCTPPPPRSTVT